MKKINKLLAICGASTLSLLTLNSCSTEPCETEFLHRGVAETDCGGMGIRHRDYRNGTGFTDDTKMREMIVDVAVFDVCDKEISEFIGDENFDRWNHLYMNMSTSDTIMMKKFLPEYSGNMTVKDLYEIWLTPPYQKTKKGYFDVWYTTDNPNHTNSDRRLAPSQIKKIELQYGASTRSR